MTHDPVFVTLKRGGDAFIVEHSGDVVTIASQAPSPPGSTLEATHQSPGRSCTIRIKVRGCRQAPLPDGRAGFRIDGRFVSLTRGDRQALFASQPETESESGSET